MKSTDLAIWLAPFAVLANRHAMSPIYKALEIMPDKIRGCSPWGILEVDLKIGVNGKFWVNAEQFVGVIKTLPSGEVTFIQTGSTLSWACGKAEGKLALLGALEIPTHEWGERPAENNVDADFPIALQLGSLSATRDIGMSSVGVAGVALTYLPEEQDAFGNIFVASSDNITMSVASMLIEGAEHWPASIIIGADASAMLASILNTSAKSTGAAIDIQEKTIVAWADNYRLMIRAAPPMQRDILEMAAQFTHEESTIPLPSDAVKRFIARAGALAEAKAHTAVKLTVGEGGFRLSFAEGTIISNEDYVIADFSLAGDFPEIRLDAARLARALGSADMLAFDAFDRGVLTLFKKEGDGPDFAYLINGAQEKGA